MSGCTAPRWRLGLVDDQYVIWAGPEDELELVTTCDLGHAQQIVAAVNLAMDTAQLCEWGEDYCDRRPAQEEPPA